MTRSVGGELVVDQHIAEAGALGDVEQRAESRPAQVGVDQQGRHPRVAATGRQLGGQRRLPLAADGAGDQHASALLQLRRVAADGEPQVVEPLDELLDLVVRPPSRSACGSIAPSAAAAGHRPPTARAWTAHRGRRPARALISSNRNSPSIRNRMPTGAAAMNLSRLLFERDLRTPAPVVQRDPEHFLLVLEIQLLELLAMMSRILGRLESSWFSHRRFEGVGLLVFCSTVRLSMRSARLAFFLFSFSILDLEFGRSGPPTFPVAVLWPSAFSLWPRSYRSSLPRAFPIHPSGSFQVPFAAGRAGSFASRASYLDVFQLFFAALMSAIREVASGSFSEFLRRSGAIELVVSPAPLAAAGPLGEVAVVLGRLEVRLDLEQIHLGLEQRVGRLGVLISRDGIQDESGPRIILLRGIRVQPVALVHFHAALPATSFSVVLLLGRSPWPACRVPSSSLLLSTLLAAR